MASDEGTASSKPPLMRSKRKASISSHTESKKKKPAKVSSMTIEATVVKRSPEREQEGSKIHQRIDYYIQY